MKPTISPELEVTIGAARVGAKIGLKYFEKNLEVKLKEDATVVTRADLEAEDAIKEFILKQDRNAKFLAEETGGDKGGDSFWIIDPIDGSRCYIRGIPFWCVLIAKFDKGEISHAVCYFPLLNNGLLYAQKSKGAFCEDRRIQVSKVNNLENSYVTFGSLRHFKNRAPLFNVIDKANGVRGYEPTYGHALLSQGKVDVSIDVFAYPWDAAPFKVMIEEAGGKISMMDGSPWTIHGRGFIATNGILHDEVVRLYNENS